MKKKLTIKQDFNFHTMKIIIGNEYKEGYFWDFGYEDWIKIIKTLGGNKIEFKKYKFKRNDKTKYLEWNKIK